MVSETGSVQNIGPFNVSDHARFADSREALGRIGLFLVGAMFAATVEAEAHEAPAGWSYSTQCCSNQDCAQIADVTVTITAEGYEVALAPGDHPMVVAPRVYVIPFGDERIRDSGDKHFHACIGVTAPQYQYEQQRLICLYRPTAGES